MSIAMPPRLIAARTTPHRNPMDAVSARRSTVAHALRVLATIALSTAVAACVETRFESPIGDNIETCDTGWKGLWLGTPDRPGERNDATAFYVNDACEFTVIDQPEKNGPLKQVHVPINYVHANGKDYVVVADTAVRSLVDIKPPHGVTPAPDKSFFFARYRLHGDRIELYPVDDARVAELVIEGKVGGTVDKTDNELHVYVHGTRAQMLDLVRTQSIFKDKDPLRLARSRQTLDQFQKSLMSGAPTEPKS
jgi:hypothetical protein